jgi:hypothetical protein
VEAPVGTMDNNDYRIQKDRLAAIVVTVGGERLTGELFVQASPRNRYGREEAADVLNSAEPFFPMLTNDGELFLIAKDRVREVESREPLPADQWQIGAPATINVWLTGGAMHTGNVYLESLSGRTRVLDYLNRVGERFVLLYTSHGTVLLNRSFIERVKPLD